MKSSPRVSDSDFLCYLSLYSVYTFQMKNLKNGTGISLSFIYVKIHNVRDFPDISLIHISI